MVAHVELRSWIRSSCGSEGDVNVGLSDGVIEYIGSPGTVVVEWLCRKLSLKTRLTLFE